MRENAQRRFDTWLLVGTNPKTIVAQGKHILFVQRHNVLNLRQSDRLAARLCVFDKFFDIHPSLGVKFQPYRFGMMAQYEAQIFTDFGEASIHV
jgi:hypothetical protein|tara:strand:- start:3028 stop:3309 length:282 start_codon:yes stop_codon:yes gene_type:complete